MTKNKYYTYIQYIGPYRYIGKGSGKRYLIITRDYNKFYTRALNKYGFNAAEIIDWFNNEEDAFDHEIILIKLGRIIGWKLLNGTDGGDGFIDSTGQMAEKRRKSLTGKKRTQEQKKKISNALKGKPNMKLKGKLPWNTGKHHSEETKKKMRFAHKDQSSTIKGKTLEEIYGVEKAQELKLKRSLVRKGIKRGKYKTKQHIKTH